MNKSTKGPQLGTTPTNTPQSNDPSGAKFRTRILHTLDVDQLEQLLATHDQDPNMQQQELRLAGFEEVQKSRIKDFYHYRRGKNQALFIKALDKFISWEGKIIANDISPILVPVENDTVLCVGFRMLQNNRHYIYELGEDFRQTGKVEPTLMFHGKNNFETLCEANVYAGRFALNMSLQGKTLEQQEQILQQQGFKRHQLSEVQALEHYVGFTDNQKGYVMVDSQHGNLLSFGGQYIFDNIAVNKRNKTTVNKSNKTTVNGITVTMGDRVFFYILGEQYKTTKKPQIRANPNSSDGGFSSENELLNYFKLLSNPPATGNKLN